MIENMPTTALQSIFRVSLGLLMIFAAIAHCTFGRNSFQAQVPDWVPLSKDLTVVLSGVVEAVLGLAMIFWVKEKTLVGLALAVFFVLIFPGNIAQYTGHRSAFGLSTDRSRLIRLFFQPVLIVLALWSTGALHWIFYSRK